MKKYLLPLMISAVVAPVAVTIAAVNEETKTTEPQVQESSQTQIKPAESQPPQARANIKAQAVQQRGWLGVHLAAVPKALEVQLNHIIPTGQGILIGHVEPNSAAEKAGLKANDVLLTFADQKLYSMQQLATLVSMTKPETEVDMQVVQKGQLQDMKVKIGAYPVAARALVNPFDNMPKFRPSMPPASSQPQQNLAWDNFESVQVKTLPSGKYHAEVSYKDNNNETKSFVFEGKKEEIIKQINNQKDLPEAKKQALLNALNMQTGQTLGQAFSHPFFQGQNNPFNDPFFQGQANPFNDPFFQRNFQLPPQFQQFLNQRLNQQGGFYNQQQRLVMPPQGSSTM